jgi:hypothetical protein
MRIFVAGLSLGMSVRNRREKNFSIRVFGAFFDALDHLSSKA